MQALRRMAWKQVNQTNELRRSAKSGIRKIFFPIFVDWRICIAFRWQRFSIGFGVQWCGGEYDKTLLTVLYLCLRMVSHDNRLVIQIFCFLIILTGSVETVWGLMQLYGFLPSQHGLFRLTGSFFNPGPYSEYLAVALPLAASNWMRKGSKRRHCEVVIERSRNNHLAMTGKSARFSTNWNLCKVNNN